MFSGGPQQANTRPFCPFLGCRRDLTVCLEYPRRSEPQKAPPRLAERQLLDITSRADNSLLSNGGNHGRPVRREAVPDLRVEGPTPTDQIPARPLAPPSTAQRHHQKSSSAPNAIRTIWPTPGGIYDPARIDQPRAPQRERYKEKPLPPPPFPPIRSKYRPTAASLAPTSSAPATSAPPPTSLNASIAARHQQLYSQQQQLQHPRRGPAAASTTTATKKKTTTTSSSSLSTSVPTTTTTTTPFSSKPTASAVHPPPPPPTDVRERPPPGKKRPPQPPQQPQPRPRPRPRSSSTPALGDILAWKTPEERARFEREMREHGNDADLFLDIIDLYREKKRKKKEKKKKKKMKERSEGKNRQY
ncbi:d15c343e-ce18-491a-aeb2-2d9608d9e671 [Thermothielavioides terrestris]|uniref:D15c343e-ce18-491a-aeb2-2d9608d9e671 n=1 Tax=Thermothielavioides terrestris TaxID=2587410 RepID=A0A3S4C4I6_9PEZI|nr:d15c343e-ce18-491a-aeb2-2d9608d9e671 [Thermothielavioides terrestris]